MTWPMPMNRSRVRTNVATSIENVANTADPSATTVTTPTTGSGSSRTWTPIASEITYTMTACASPRTLPAVALPRTTPAREAGLASTLCSRPTSRSQMTVIPKKMAMNSALWDRIPGAR